MKLRNQYHKPLSLLLLATLTACGGDGSNPLNTSGGTTTQPDSTSATNSSANLPSPPNASMTMSCVDGSSFQCSGSSIIRVENGVTLTSSGVQVYGKSTNDLAPHIEDPTSAYGLTLASGGFADLRIDKASNGTISHAAMVLRNLGVSFDSIHERAPIIEAFHTAAGRTVLTSNGAVGFAALPDSSDLSFYDYASKGSSATQANYANNQYFPRNTPARCPAYMAPCPDIETTGIHYSTGDWRTGGKTPDLTKATREHGDGDIQAGNGLPDANGKPTYMNGASAPGVPYAGTKGTRDLVNWSFLYSNLGAWKTKDTVAIAEWGGPVEEHNQNRRGMTAFGNVTDPAAIPTARTASYSGFVYGWYTRNATDEAVFFRGEAQITADFGTRQVSIKILNTMGDFDSTEQFATSVPITFTASTAMGAPGTSAANYLTGQAGNDALKGGISGRYFGPVASTGTSGAGPAEVGGAFSLSNSTTGQAVVGGFIGRKL